MKKITFKKLMEKIDDGMAEVNAWERNGSAADVTFYKDNGRGRRVVVEVTGRPDDHED